MLFWKNHGGGKKIFIKGKNPRRCNNRPQHGFSSFCFNTNFLHGSKPPGKAQARRPGEIMLSKLPRLWPLRIENWPFVRSHPPTLPPSGPSHQRKSLARCGPQSRAIQWPLHFKALCPMYFQHRRTAIACGQFAGFGLGLFVSVSSVSPMAERVNLATPSRQRRSTGVHPLPPRPKISFSHRTKCATAPEQPLAPPPEINLALCGSAGIFCTSQPRFLLRQRSPVFLLAPFYIV